MRQCANCASRTNPDRSTSAHVRQSRRQCESAPPQTGVTARLREFTRTLTPKVERVNAVDSAPAILEACLRGYDGAGLMRHYRINKVTRPGGVVLKKKDVLATSDTDAVQKAAESEDCPVCEILKDGQHVGSIV